MYTHHLGLRFLTDVPFGAPHTTGSQTDGADVVVSVGEPIEENDSRPVGEVLAHHCSEGRDFYTVVRHDGRYLLRVHTLADFLVDASGRAVLCRAVTGTPTEMLSVLLAGTVTALLWIMRGRSVLHASSVLHSSGKVVAFAGPSGSGKSTVAAVCCAAGAALVADDLLVLDPQANDLGCLAGGGEIRLRPGMASLIQHWENPVTRQSADGRKALAVRSAAGGRHPLATVAFLYPDPNTAEVSWSTVRGTNAVMALLAQSRLCGIADPSWSATLLDAAVAVAERADVVAVRVPWPPSPAVGFQLMDGLCGGAVSISVEGAR